MTDAPLARFCNGVKDVPRLFVDAEKLCALVSGKP